MVDSEDVDAVSGVAGISGETITPDKVGTTDDPVKSSTIDSVDTDTSVVVSGDDTMAYGRDHGATVDGDNVVIGVGARALADANQTVSGDDPRAVHIGFEAGRASDQFGTVGTGYLALRNNTGNRAVGAGYLALRNNTGNRAVGTGNRALRNNTGNRAVGTGSQALENNTGNRAVGTGYLALENNTGANAVGTGYLALRGDGLADPNDMGDYVIAIGSEAGRNNTGHGAILIGAQAGTANGEDDVLIVTDRDGNERYKGWLKAATDEAASDFETLGDGAGLIVTSPDGSTRQRITIDNNGDVIAEAV
jgi:hypothetical protein